MGELSGKRAVITGGGTGIGLACAKALAAQGAETILMGRNLDRLRRAAAEIEGARAVQLDVTSDESVSDAFGQARKLGSIDILVNNAGIAASAPFLKIKMEDWRRIQAVNVEGVVRCTQAVLEDMLAADYARIVNIASIAGLHGGAYISHYVASKHALVGLTRALAVEIGKSKLTVNAICPGYVATDMAEQAIDTIMTKTGRTREEAIAQLATGNPKGRLIEPEEIGSACAYLCSPAAGATNGETIAINGGPV